MCVDHIMKKKSVPKKEKLAKVVKLADHVKKKNKEQQYTADIIEKIEQVKLSVERINKLLAELRASSQKRPIL